MTILKGNSVGGYFDNAVVVDVVTDLNTDGCDAVLSFGEWSGRAPLIDGAATFTFTKEETDNEA